MKEAYAVRRTVPPSAEIQANIDKLLGAGWSTKYEATAAVNPRQHGDT